eukprot:5075503-Prymnesium_polylepis.1
MAQSADHLGERGSGHHMELQLVQITAPPGVQPGQEMTFNSPTGELMKVVVPAGVPPGGTFTLNIPKPTAVPTAVPVVPTAVPVPTAA